MKRILASGTLVVVALMTLLVAASILRKHSADEATGQRALREQVLGSLKRFEFVVANTQEPGTLATAKKSSRYFTQDLGEGIGLDMVEVPAGTFWMGSSVTDWGKASLELFADPQDMSSRIDWAREAPRHQVKIGGFFMGRYEVTREQWLAVSRLPKVNRALTRFVEEIMSGDNSTLPVHVVPWDEAVEFCERLTKKSGIRYRLPTEAEWEYACRAGTTTAYHFGTTVTPQLATYNYKERPGEPRLTPVGGKGVANNFGLYDMHGNVAEWCLDPAHVNYKGAPDDGRVWTDGGDWHRHILRGGSFLWSAQSCRSAARYFAHDKVSASGFGFRVAAEMPLE
jgi:formylglycine-generating enzyme required for sulfatase activity